MGAHAMAEDPASNYVLHGWKGNEDEDVDVDSEGEAKGRRRQVVAISSSVQEPMTMKNGHDSAEMSVQETSDVGDSSVAKARLQRSRTLKDPELVLYNTSTAAKEMEVVKVVEEPEAVSLLGESSSTRSTSRRKRLNARRFRDHFAAKLKRPNMAKGSDCDLDTREEEGTMQEVKSPSSDVSLRQEHSRWSMKGAAEQDMLSKTQLVEVVETTAVSKGAAVDEPEMVCNKCKRGGKLIWCDGKDCKVAFHIDCLDPPLMDVPLNDWCCPDCEYKRIFSGMHSVSKGIESIWAVKEGNPGETPSSSQGVLAHKMPETQQGKLQRVEALKGAGDQKLEETEHHSSMPNTVKAQSEPAIDTRLSVSGACAEKMYFVKFKGVAHIHNLWLSESQVLREAPQLLHSFKQLVEQGKGPQWDPDWVKPFRVIGKRRVMLPSSSDIPHTSENGVESGHCVEWCIKWKKLGYEHCTWELADRTPVKSSYVKKLMDNFHIRSEKAKRRSQAEKTSKLGAVPNSRLPLAFMRGEHQSQLEVIEKLLCNWQKDIHSVVINEMNEGRMRIAAGFLVCLLEQYAITKPCLVVVPTPLLAEWKVAFQKWMPTGTVVLYAGSQEARRMIQRYEFYNEDGICMVQIALTSFDVLNTDIEVLKGLNLEAIIIDECQRLKGTKTSNSLHLFAPCHRFLLFSEPIKDILVDYQFLDALLSNCDDLSTEREPMSHDDNATSMKLKAAVSKHIVEESKQELSGPKEFWIPVKMTALQVKQYCKLLIDKCDMLARNKRGDIASSPNELLPKIRECCNHPYLVNPSLQESLTNLSPKELLDFGIGASGKLKLLDRILAEAKSLKKRIVVITQIHLRAGKVSQMDILDDYMRQQFGVDSYERLDGGLEKSKKIAAVQRFNAVESKSFVFLLDRRACGPAIRLRSVNCIVIFDSDWSPQTDIQALLRMHSSSDLQDIAICRFYCPYTVEERALISARKQSDLDANHHNFTQSLCQKLLRWGAHKNFELFDSFSRDKDKVKLADELNYSSEFVTRVVGNDFFDVGSEGASIDSLWKTALYPRLAGQYDKGPPLVGETSEELLEEETVSATEFWTEIFRERQVEASDGQVRELRARKKVQYHEDSTTNTEELIGEEESRRKRRKIGDFPDFTNAGKGGKPSSADRLENLERPHVSEPSDNVEIRTAVQPPKPTVVVEAAQLPSGSDRVHVNKTTNENRVGHGGPEAGAAEGTNDPATGAKSEQQQLLLSMKLDLEKLCQALQFQADTAGHVEQLLLSVGNFFKLPKDKSLLHAIELSLCWLAAEQQHYSIDRHATLVLAEACFGVQLDKIDTVYAKLEERWKKRIEQGAQLAPAVPRLQDNNDIPHRVEQAPTGRIAAEQEPNRLKEKQGLSQAPSRPRTPSQAPSRPRTPEDARIAGTLQNGQEMFPSREAAHLQQGPMNTVVSEQQPLSVPPVNNIVADNIQTQPTHGQPHVVVPGSQVSDGLQEPLSDASRVASTQHPLTPTEKQRSEQVQAIIHAQETQLRSLELLENSYKQKLTKHYELTLSKLKSSRHTSSSECVKLFEGLKGAFSTLSIYFRAIRNNMKTKPQEERSKGNTFMTSQLERNNASETVTLENIDTDFSEKRIHDSLPQGLKTALQTGDFGAVCVASGPDQINLPVAYTGGAAPSSASQGSQELIGADNQSLPLPPDSGIPSPVPLHSQPSLDVSESQLHVAPNQQQQRHLPQRQVKDNVPQRPQQRRSSDLVQPQAIVSSGHQEHHWQNAQSQLQRLPVTLSQLSMPPAPPVPPSPPSLIPPTPHPQPQPQIQSISRQPQPPVPPSLSSPIPTTTHPQPQPQPQPQIQSISRQPQPPVPPTSSSPIPSAPHSHFQSQIQSISRQPQPPPEVQQPQSMQGGVSIPGHQQVSGSALAHSNEAAQPILISATHQPTTTAHPSSVLGRAVGTSVAHRTPQSVHQRTNQQYQNDPLAQEFLRLRKEQEKARSAHEVEKDRIKGQFMKELEVISKKYEAMLQEEDSLYTQKAAALDINLKKVEMNRRLAEVFRLKNSQDGSFLNSGTVGQDGRMLAGNSQVLHYQQHTPPNAIRTPLTSQGTVATPALPLVPNVGQVSGPLFEQATRASTLGVAGAQLAGTPAVGASWHLSQGVFSQAANAGSPTAPIASQSRNVSGQQQSAHLLHEGSRLLASRVSAQACGAMNVSLGARSLPAGVPNTLTSSVSPASFVRVQDAQNMNILAYGGNSQVSQCIGSPLGRISTTYVQTYATSVTPQCSIMSTQVPGDTGNMPQTQAGGVQPDSLVPLGMAVPLSDFSAMACERLACDAVGTEITRPPSGNAGDCQDDQNRYTVATTHGHSSDVALNEASLLLSTVQTHVINGLGSTHEGRIDENRNTLRSDVICLSDDD